MFAPTPEQSAVIDHFSGHGLVIAGPGSGKTVALIAHVKKLILERNVSPDDIWVMAFNRDISTKLREKLQVLGEQTPETTTIHTFIFRQFHQHGRELLGEVQIADDLGDCGKRNLLWGPIRERLTRTYGITKTQDGRKLTVRHIEGRLFDRLRDSWLVSQEPPNDDLFNKFKHEFERSQRIYKIIFLDQLAIRFLEAIVKNPSFRHEVARPRIIIDEFQDLDPTEHAILQEFHNEGTTFMVFGDDDQAVNDFRRAHADFIRDFAEKFKPKQFPLARDRRCPKEILSLADEFVKGLPRFSKSSGNAHHKGKVDILSFENDDKEKHGISSITKKYLESFPEFEEKPQILILCGRAGARNRPHFAEIIATLRADKILDVTGDEREDPFDNEWGVAFKSLLGMLVEGILPMNLAAWLSVTNRALLKMINASIEIEERKGNAVDYLKIVTEMRKYNVKLDAELAGIENLRERIKNEENFQTSLVTDFIPLKLEGRAEGISIVEKTWKEYEKSNLNASSEDNTKGQSSKGAQFLQAMKKYMSENSSPEIGRVHVTTYRKSKGLEADLVIVTSVDSSEFFDQDQKRRLLYVAATRSKRNLIMTFAEKVAGARSYKRGRREESKGNPRVYCSPLIPTVYRPQEYSEQWLKIWTPV